MILASLLSGGKDSVYSTYYMSSIGNTVKYAITVYPQNPDSLMFHTPNLLIAPWIAKALGCEHISIKSESNDTDIAILEQTLKKLEIQGIVAGAIRSNFQWSQLNDMAERLNLPLFAPLWRKEEEIVLNHEINSGMEIYFSSVSAEGLSLDLVGRKLDKNMLNHLIELRKRYKINISGEGGEYETVVLNAPFFKYRINVIKSNMIIESNRAFWNIEKFDVINMER
jgi:ABC transporter with metal-binding/Fe-S-binding domain ATP-binding protein